MTPVGSCALPVVNPKTNEVQGPVSSRERGFDPSAWLKCQGEIETVNCTQGMQMMISQLSTWMF